MSAQTEDTRTVVIPEAADIQAMRKTLKAIAIRLIDTHHSPTEYDAQCHGRLQEAVDTASSALFRLLNVASSYGHCEAASDALNFRRDGAKS